MSVIREHDILRQLAAGCACIPHVTTQVERKPERLQALLAAVTSDAARVKFGAIKALRMVS
jgi:hypothetical protein